MFKHIKLLALSAVAASALAAASASAATVYDVVNDFSTTSAVGTWSYGTGVTGTSFTALPDFHATCEGASGISCWQVSSPVDRVPLIAKNLTGHTVNIYNTVTQPTDVLNVHPGPSTDAIVQFIAPTSSFYTISSFFQTLDVNPSGVVVDVFKNSTQLLSQVLQGQPASNTAGGGIVTFDDRIYLAAGDKLSFGVNNDGSYYNDSTGLSATISAVPEPTTWAMMLVGLGAMGVSLRSARRKTVAVTA
jgi:hypothetical protein